MEDRIAVVTDIYVPCVFYGEALRRASRLLESYNLKRDGKYLSNERLTNERLSVERSKNTQRSRTRMFRFEIEVYPLTMRRDDGVKTCERMVDIKVREV